MLRGLVSVWLLVTALGAAGCAPVVVEQAYPRDWPALAGAAGGCGAIAGVYEDGGAAAEAAAGEPAPSLAGLLAEAPPAGIAAVRIAVPGGNTIALAGRDAAGRAVPLRLKRAMVFGCTAGRPTISYDRLTADPMATFSEDHEIVLLRAADGALILRSTYRARGYFFFTPINDRRLEWYRFQPAAP